MDFLELLNNPYFLAFLARVAGSVAGSAITKTYENTKRATVENLMYDCVETAYQNTCTEMGWEYDDTSITETLLPELTKHNGRFTEEDLMGILEAVAGKETVYWQNGEGLAATYFGDQIMRQIAKPEHQELWRYLIAENILQPPYDSARAMCMSFANRTNRFHFSSGKVGFFGREDELKALAGFCGEDNPFLWWAVTGSGGEGKSRLAYHFATEVPPEGWSYCFRRGDKRDVLRECSESLPKNTLFIIDYAEENTGEVFEWMANDLLIQKHTEIKIRVLLLQRSGKTLEDIYGREGCPDNIRETFFDKSALVLPDPDGSVLARIAASYASTEYGCKLDEAIQEMIIAKMKSFSKGKDSSQKFMRPLFALALADAYARGMSIHDWDRENLLDSLYRREKTIIEKSLKERCETKDYSGIGLKTLLVATVIGEVSFDDDFVKAILTEREYRTWIEGEEDKTAAFLSNPNLFPNEEGICLALEPDIIGEYLVIKYFSLKKLEKSREQLANFIWAHIPEATSFLRRLTEDFDDMTRSEELQSLCSNISIPEGVKEIEDDAFSGCTSLRSVTIPGGVKEIGAGAFSDCTGLVSVTILEGVTEIGNGAFKRCSSLASVTIPEGVAVIGEMVFYGCTGLTSVSIPKSVTEIGNGAFGGCTGLVSVKIPEGVTVIGDWSFKGCKGLADDEGFVIVRNVLYDYVGDKSEAIIPEGITELGMEAFSSYTGLASVSIPKSVTKIGREAFYGCTSLASVSIPKSVTKIELKAFYGCTSLASVTIPESVIEIRSAAFMGCKGLADDEGFVIVRNVLYGYVGDKSEVIIPEGVTVIGDWAFFGCMGLISVIILNEATVISDRAFHGCVPPKVIRKENL